MILAESWWETWTLAGWSGMPSTGEAGFFVSTSEHPASLQAFTQ